jgi:hypothetical protein
MKMLRSPIDHQKFSDRSMVQSQKRRVVQNAAVVSAQECGFGVAPATMVFILAQCTMFYRQPTRNKCKVGE